MKRILFVDIDGVMADSVAYWLSLFNRDNQTKHTVNEITEWAHPIAMQLRPYFHNYIHCPAVPGAFESVWRLSEKYRIVYATSGYGRQWLESHVHVPEKDFIQCQDKSLLNGWGLVDDNPMNLDVFHGQRFLLRQPWNTGRGLNDATWEQITKYLEAL